MDLKRFAIGEIGANCYLIKTEDVTIAVDPFEADDRIKSFFEANEKLKKFILLTHCHYDHILGAEKLRSLYDCKVVIGQKDEIGLRDPSISLSGLAGYRQKPFSADITVSNGDVLRIGNTEITVIETPGHTAGSVCYVIEDSIFTGDTLFQGTVGRTDLPTGDYSALMTSLDKFRRFDRDYKLYPGHGLATTLDRELNFNPYIKKLRKNNESL